TRATSIVDQSSGSPPVRGRLASSAPVCGSQIRTVLSPPELTSSGGQPGSSTQMTSAVPPRCPANERSSVPVSGSPNRIGSSSPPVASSGRPSSPVPQAAPPVPSPYRTAALLSAQISAPVPGSQIRVGPFQPPVTIRCPPSASQPSATTT